MSKRYREVLAEVETPTSRAQDRAGAESPDPPDEPGPPGAGSGSASGPSRVSSRGSGRGGSDGAGSGGGVATLVRPVATAAEAVAVPVHARSPTSPVARRPTRPGNGPVDAEEPLAFAWRGRRYEVTRILGHWREEEGWWRRPDGEPIRIEQSDLWRVEATRGAGTAWDARGIYELARRGTTWRLDRVWD